MKTHLLVSLIVSLLVVSCSGPVVQSTNTATAVLQDTPTAVQTAAHTPTLAAATATFTPTRPAATATTASTPTLTEPTAAPTETQAAASAQLPNGAIVVDHNSVALFELIPEEYLTAARNLHMVFMDQSVGKNVSDGLDCLASPSWADSPAFCRRDYDKINGSQWEWKTYTGADLQAGSVPKVIQFSADSTRYNRSNWTFIAETGGWDEYLSKFLQNHAPVLINNNDVLSFQFTYLHVASGSTIADPKEGFFADQPHDGYYSNRDRWDISDLRDYEAKNPNKTFIYWTTSLAREIGSAESTAFNDQMRQYAIANHKPLLDAADILSHDPNGQPCYDNRDGVEYCGPKGCENTPDDNLNYPAICQAYTTESDGGHLGSVSGGRIQMAKAFWVLMAQIAGWRP